jgi:hypothetical protein
MGTDWTTLKVRTEDYREHIKYKMEHVFFGNKEEAKELEERIKNNPRIIELRKTIRECREEITAIEEDERAILRSR